MSRGPRACMDLPLPYTCSSKLRRQVWPWGFYGATPQVLASMLDACGRRFNGLHVAYAYAPPFRQLTTEEDATVVSDINASGTRILFVGLGCPKQERWMAAHRGAVHAPMLGVGAAFDFLAGTKPQAPAWMQRAGLEWLFRLATEPRRLWRRYAYHNPRFVATPCRTIRQVIGSLTSGEIGSGVIVQRHLIRS